MSQCQKNFAVQFFYINQNNTVGLRLRWTIKDYRAGRSLLAL